MTTLLGIAAKKGSASVVMASDLASTDRRYEDKGDIVVRKQTTKETQKIYIDKEDELAVSMAGIRDGKYNEFLYSLREGDINFREVIETGFFNELFNLNKDRFEGKCWNGSYENSLLVSTRYDGEPKLWECFPLGKIEEREIAALGSGSEYACNYFEEGKEILSAKEIDTERAIDLASYAINSANKDLHTIGLDLVVVTPEKIFQFGNKIKKDRRCTEEKILEDIKNCFK